MEKIHLIMPMGGAGSRFFKDGYVMPNKDLTLEGNVGGSLTELNENIYLSSIKDIMQREYIDKIEE